MVIVNFPPPSLSFFPLSIFSTFLFYYLYSENQFIIYLIPSFSTITRIIFARSESSFVRFFISIVLLCNKPFNFSILQSSKPNFFFFELLKYYYKHYTAEEVQNRQKKLQITNGTRQATPP
jgi:hypothetical protein